eukprot:1622297-Alexandrium_andersonii.AAC.1
MPLLESTIVGNTTNPFLGNPPDRGSHIFIENATPWPMISPTRGPKATHWRGIVANMKHAASKLLWGSLTAVAIPIIAQ